MTGKFLKMPEYPWTCQKCMNMPMSTRRAFFYMSPIFFLHVFIFFTCYFNKVYIVRKNEAVFLKTQNSIFSIVAGSAWFVFCFRLNICTRFQICCYLLEPRGLGTVNLDRPLKSSKTINIIREIFILNALLRISSLCKGL